MNKLKLFLLSSLICLALSTFAQSSSAYTPVEKGEYLFKIMMNDMTFDSERMVQIRNAIYKAAREEQEVVDIVGERKDEATLKEVEKIKTERDHAIRGVLTEEEYIHYEDIVKNLYAEIYELKRSK